MPETIKTSERGMVEILTENDGKIIRRTVNAELSVYAALKNSECKYLPKIYSAEIADGKTIVTEEFIEGKTLLAANLDGKKTVRAMVQLCAALEFIHGFGIVHRDIKPSNILFANDGNIRLIDFEAARFVRNDKDKDTRYLGTDGFAPPEQYGFSQTDFRTDIYAAGQTFKTLLGSLSADKKYAKIIKKATALDPAERYQSAKEFANALTNKRGKISVSAVLAVAVAVTLFAAFTPKEITENISADNVVAEIFSAETTNNISEISEEFTYFGVPENPPEYDRADLLFYPEDENAEILFTNMKKIISEREKFYLYYDLDGDGVNEAVAVSADGNGFLNIQFVYGVPQNGSYSGCGGFWSEYLTGIDFSEKYFLQITFFEIPYNGRYAALTVGDGENINVTEIYAVKNGVIEYIGCGKGETTAAMSAQTLNEYFADGRHNVYMLLDGELSVIDEYPEIDEDYSLRDIFENFAAQEGY
ncbi:MAG: protein kinase [Prevotella sp.]|nr:protein kinase [Prevotella sp.]